MGNGYVTHVGQTNSGFLKRDCRTHCNKLICYQGKTRHWRRNCEGNGDKVQCYTKGGELLVLGDCIISNVGSDCLDMKVGCFPGIRSEQLQRVIVKRDLGDPNAVVIHVGTNDIKRTRNHDYVMGDTRGI